MFQVPDWEVDVPTSNSVFSVKAKKNNAKKENFVSNGDTTQKPNKITKIKSTNTKVNNGTTSPEEKMANKRKKGFSMMMRNEDESLEMDEMLVKAKKKKLDEIYKREDCETKLFGDDAKESDSSQNSKLNLKSSDKRNKKSAKKRKNGENNNHENVNGIRASAKKIKLDAKKMENGKGTSLKNKKNTKTNLETNISTEVEIPDKVGTTNNHKKEKFKKVLEQSHRRPIQVAGDRLRQRMLERLKAAQFRYLNEKLYTSSGNEAQKIFQEDPTAFVAYHQGYQQQVKKWPVNPLDVIVKKIQKMPKSFTIADMGCGEAALSRKLAHKVHSFDLVSSAPGVIACDIARTPLLKQSVDVVVYCLALMGTQLTQYLLEANRVLKTGGQLLIAEVVSRFDDINNFTKEVERLGFKLKNLDKQHSVFVFLHYVKVNDPPVKKGKLPTLTLKPCLYKKR